MSALPARTLSTILRDFVTFERPKYLDLQGTVPCLSSEEDAD